MKTEKAPAAAVKQEGPWNTNPSFFQWLFFRRTHAGVQGLVARWVHDDIEEDGGVPCWPHRSNTLSHMIGHLRRYHYTYTKDGTYEADDGVPTELMLRRTFTAYRKFLEAGGKVPVRQGGVAKSNNVHRGFFLPEETMNQIKELATWENTTQGDIIEQSIASAHAKYTSNAS
jgi:hypothetical protein